MNGISRNLQKNLLFHCTPFTTLQPEHEWPEMDAKKFDKVWLGQLKIIEELIEQLPFVFWTAKTAT